MSAQLISCLLKVRGIVQGVGFRPFVFNLAGRYSLTGKVLNSGTAVLIEVEGEADRVEGFIAELQAAPPALARIEQLDREFKQPWGYKDFSIEESCGAAGGTVLVPSDLALCPACRKEIHNPADRHFRYPFTNCTNCGPRFAIVQGLPYDRCRTSMVSFPMCLQCQREYSDPTNRRFHAQPVACPHCGPRLQLVERSGTQVAALDCLSKAGSLLKGGSILAVKGLGGFHLACAADNKAAVRELRRRKKRPFQPFAVMGRDLEEVEKHCLLTAKEAELLQAPAVPIVLVQKRDDCKLPEELAPGLNALGVMLPYTPLHLLLLEEGPPLLVMTSGNQHGLPLVIENQEAIEQLRDLADYFLWHDRMIVNRCDDSVTAVLGGEVQLLRRSRGYVPEALTVPVEASAPVILGIGGEMKNTFCLLSAGKAYLSQHMGEMHTREGYLNLANSVHAFCRLLGIKPAVIACDLHPAYHSARLAGELAAMFGAEKLQAVQHHHAHLAACLAENRVTEEAIGIILDGTGYGLDGNLWGFEILTGDLHSFSREYHLAYVPLPGGERAVQNPWLTAAAYLMTFLGTEGKKVARRLFAAWGRELDVAEQMLTERFNSPLASSCGRLFDAAAALLGICTKNTYEGEAPALLGSLVEWFPSDKVSTGFAMAIKPYAFSFEGRIINPGPVLAQMLEDMAHGVAIEVIAARFHDTVIAMVVEAAQKVREATGISIVALSGGSWQNRYLAGVTKLILEGYGFTVFYHRSVPPGDGGLALGQAVVAAHKRLLE